MPKSRTSAFRRAPVETIMMFAGLRSRWTIARAVRAPQGVEHLGHEVAGLGRVEPALLGEELGQVLPREELEDGVDDAPFGLPRVDEADDVGVVHLRADLHLALEAGDALLGGLRRGPVGQAQHLDRHGLARGQLPRLVHRPEAALAERALDLVPLAEDCAYRLNEIQHTPLLFPRCPPLHLTDPPGAGEEVSGALAGRPLVHLGREPPEDRHAHGDAGLDLIEDDAPRAVGDRRDRSRRRGSSGRGA